MSDSTPTVTTPTAGTNDNDNDIENDNLHIVFLHLDLGIGGAEQLIVNLALASLPHDNDNDNDNDNDKSNTTFDKDIDKSDYLNAKVSIFTTHCDQSHCFDAVRHATVTTNAKATSTSDTSDTIKKEGKLAKSVHIVGSYIPTNIFGYGTVFFSTIRMMYLSLIAKWMFPHADVFVLDILPTPIPFLVHSFYHMIGTGTGTGTGSAKCVIYYCHFPDKLLTRDTVNGIALKSSSSTSTTTTTTFKQAMKQVAKKWYRSIMDSIEEWSMSYSDLTCVNSNFTKTEVLNAFPRLRLEQQNSKSNSNSNSNSMQVLYPAIDLNKFIPPNFESKMKCVLHDKSAPIVSLNRFERKKNIDVLLHAYAILHKNNNTNTNDNDSNDNKNSSSSSNNNNNLPPLIISGGYDPRNTENVEYLQELQTLAQKLHIDQNTHFRPSISDDERANLLQSAICVVYTPHREHFGIVPLEAMYAGSAVVAGNSGGPIETVLQHKTGILVDMEPGKDDDDQSSSINLSIALNDLLTNPKKAIEMGKAGHFHVKEKFGLEPFRKQWKDIVLNKAIPNGIERQRRQRDQSSPSSFHYGIGIIIVFVAMIMMYFNQSS